MTRSPHGSTDKVGWSELGGLGRDTLLLWTVQVFYRLSGIIVLIVLSRRLSTDDIGIFFFSLSLAESLLVVANFSLDSVMMRRVAADPDGAPRYISSLLGFRLFSSPVYLACIFLASLILARQIWPVILTVAVFVLAENVYYSLFNFFVALKNVLGNVLVGITVQILFLLLFLVGMWWAPSLWTFLGANLFRSFCLLIAISIFTFRRIRNWQPAATGAFLKEGVPFLVLTAIALLQEKVDTLLLGLMTDYQAVAFYSLALRVAIALSFIPLAMGTACFPHLAADPSGRRSKFIIVRGVMILGCIGLAAMAVGYLGAVPLTALLFGGLSGKVSVLLKPLTLLFPIQFLGFFLTLSLQALKAEKKALIAQAFGTASSVLLNIFLIPMLSIHGAIIAKLVSSFLQLFFLAAYLRRLELFAPPREHA
jgi:O-antigen/teichoic acid export membrane protein